MSLSFAVKIRGGRDGEHRLKGCLTVKDGDDGYEGGGVAIVQQRRLFSCVDAAASVDAHQLHCSHRETSLLPNLLPLLDQQTPAQDLQDLCMNSRPRSLCCRLWVTAYPQMVRTCPRPIPQFYYSKTCLDDARFAEG